MSEIRLTLDAGDFGPVSRTLIEMGVGFRVEPLREPAVALPAAAPATRTPVAKAKGAKVAKKPAPARGRKPSLPATGAERLRSALSRPQPTSESLFRQLSDKPEAEKPAGEEP